MWHVKDLKLELKEHLHVMHVRCIIVFFFFFCPSGKLSACLCRIRVGPSPFYQSGSSFQFFEHLIDTSSRLLAWLLVTIASSAAFRGSIWAFSATVAVLGHKYPLYVTPTGNRVLGVAHPPRSWTLRLDLWGAIENQYESFVQKLGKF